MTFDEMLEQVRELLQSKGRIAYRALKRRFDLDDEYLEDLKANSSKPNVWQWMKTVRCWSGRAESKSEGESPESRVANSLRSDQNVKSRTPAL